MKGLAFQIGSFSPKINVNLKQGQLISEDIEETLRILESPSFTVFFQDFTLFLLICNRV